MQWIQHASSLHRPFPLSPMEMSSVVLRLPCSSSSLAPSHLKLGVLPCAFRVFSLFLNNCRNKKHPVPLTPRSLVFLSYSSVQRPARSRHLHLINQERCCSCNRSWLPKMLSHVCTLHWRWCWVLQCRWERNFHALIHLLQCRCLWCHHLTVSFLTRS